MNPALTSNVLKSINSNEIGVLSEIDGTSTSLSDGVFAGDFKTAIQEVLSASGNLKPLGFADLKQLEGLDVQQLTNLAGQLGIELPADILSESIEARQLSLNMLGAKVESGSLIANPNANELLKEKLSKHLTNIASSDNGLLKTPIDTPEPLSKVLKTDAIQQLSLKKESNVLQGLIEPDLDLAQYIKSLNKNEGVLSSELLQTGIKDIDTTKIADQLLSIDKPVNSITTASNTTLPTIFEQNKPALMLRRIEVPVNQPAWGEAVGNRLMTMVNDKMQSANIQLNPRELGPIEVRINVNQDQASVHFITSNAAVRDAVEEAFPRLREMFLQNGISLADANVSQQSPQQQGNAYANEQSDSLQTIDNKLLEKGDTETGTTNDETMAMGLVDQYV